VKWRDRDHTRGSLWASLFVLAVPLLANSLVGGVAFQLVDLAFLSSLGEDATTAVIVTNQSLRQLFFMLVMGASFGAQGLVARAVGAGDGRAADHVAGQVVLLGAGLAAAMALLGLLVPREMLAAMNVAAPVLDAGTSYVRLTFVLAFGMIFGFLVNAILNGAGDSTTTLRISLVQTSVSLLAEWVLIFGKLGLPPLGVDGVALGLALGQAAGLALGLHVLFSGSSRVHVRAAHLRPDPALLRRLVALSFPPALQMIGGFLVTALFLRRMGSFGPEAQAAYSIGLRLAMVGPMLAFPVAGACATLVGQSLGARDVPRAWRAFGVGLVAHAALLGSLALGLALFRTQVVASFADDPEVIRIGSEVLLYQAGNFAAWAFYFVLFRGLQGAGDVAVPMVVSLASSLLVTLPLGFAWAESRGPSGIFAASLVGSVVITAATAAWMLTGRWTRRGVGWATPEPDAADTAG
jgi:putative MATE family efflux protein